MTPLISIVIPVKNGDVWLDDSLSAILQQTLFDKTEIIIIDSGSTDRSLNIISRYPVKVVRIPDPEFNHGTTRNLGVQKSAGRFVVMTVQDAKPYDKYWLEELLNGFDEDNVAGVCGQQFVPHHPDKNPLTWFRPVNHPFRTKFSFSKEEFNSLPPWRKKDICSWDNVNAMYRKEVLLKFPFQKVAFAEDVIWAKDILTAGYSIVYNPKARVEHYHYEDPSFTFKRVFTEYYHFYKFFGLKPSIKNLPSRGTDLLRNIKIIAVTNGIPLNEKWKWLKINYHNQQAALRAARLFHQSLDEGEGMLEQVHTNVCGESLQAVKPKNI